VTTRPGGFVELDDFDAVFHALAHRARRTILSLLHGCGGFMTSGAIAEQLPSHDEQLMPGRDSVPVVPPAGVAAMVVLDWKDGKIVGLEVLDASAFFSR
jgi:hypothetical protein